MQSHGRYKRLGNLFICKVRFDYQINVVIRAHTKIVFMAMINLWENRRVTKLEALNNNL